MSKQSLVVLEINPASAYDNVDGVLSTSDGQKSFTPAEAKLLLAIRRDGVCPVRKCQNVAPAPVAEEQVQRAADEAKSSKQEN